MSGRFRVQIPVEPVVIQAAGTTTTAWLPSVACHVGEFLVRPGATGRHEIVLEVQARDQSEAKDAASRQAQDLLNLLAVQGDALNLLPWEATAEQIDSPQSVATVSRNGTVTLITTDGAVAVEGRVVLAKIRNDLSQEERWWRGRGRWSDRLRRALGVNRLATLANDSSVRFLMLVTSLETLAGSAGASSRSPPPHS